MTEDIEPEENKISPEEAGTTEKKDQAASSSYILNLRLLLRLLPTFLDHASDVPVLLALWAGQHRQLFWVGLAIDLMPGPVTGKKRNLEQNVLLRMAFQPFLSLSIERGSKVQEWLSCH